MMYVDAMFASYPVLTLELIGIPIGLAFAGAWLMVWYLADRAWRAACGFDECKAK